MDILYKKVFNNQYLNKQIYDFVQYKREDSKDQYGEDDFSQSYDEIENSYNIVDLEIGILLKKRQFKLLGSVIDNYFKYVVDNGKKENPYKYWYFVINPTKVEIRQLLKWNGLGYNRFILLFNEFKHVFESTKKTNVKFAMIGGNFEIFQFLLDQGYPMNLNIENVTTEIEKFNCNGNSDIFKVILDRCFNKKITTKWVELIKKVSDKCIKSTTTAINKYQNTDFYYGSQTHISNYWLTDHPSTTHQYSSVYKSLYPNSGVKDSNLIILILHCLRNQDLSLAKIIIENMNNNLHLQLMKDPMQSSVVPFYNNSKSLILFKSIVVSNFHTCRLGFTKGTFNVLKYIINNHVDVDYTGSNTACHYPLSNDLEDTLIFISECNTQLSKVYNKDSNINIYGFNLNFKDPSLTSTSIQTLFKVSLEHGYIPNSLDEFKYIINDTSLKGVFETKSKIFGTNYKNLFSHITRNILDLEYLKYAFNYYYPNYKICIDGDDDNVIGPMVELILTMLDSSYGIVSWVFNTLIIQLEIGWYEKYNHRFYFYSTFYGDLKTAELILPITSLKLDSSSTLQTVIQLDYFDIFKFILNHCVYQLSQSIISNRIVSRIVQSNRWKMFDYLIQFNLKLPSPFKIFDDDNSNLLDPTCLAIWSKYRYTTISTTKSLLHNSIYLHGQYKFPNLYYSRSNNRMIYNAIQFNSTKILNHRLNNDILEYISNSKYILSNLIRYNSKKLIYLFNFENGDNLILKTSNFQLIIIESILSNNYIIPQYILNCTIVSKTPSLKHEFIRLHSKYSNLITHNKKKSNSNGISLSK